MKLKTPIAALTGAAIGIAAHNYYIDADRGGVVVAYVAKYDQLEKQGEHVVIRGDCASSCTIALGYPNVCLGPKAVLRFHPAYVPILFGALSYVIDWPATQVMLSHYPVDARAVIDKHGDLTKNPGGWFYPRLFSIRADEFPQHYQCKPI